jgi:2,4-dienoyl-CoA reductase-like NADH-dependent reductase (Old Yellow Enzyme family)
MIHHVFIATLHSHGYQLFHQLVHAGKFTNETSFYLRNTTDLFSSILLQNLQRQRASSAFWIVQMGRGMCLGSMPIM